MDPTAVDDTWGFGGASSESEPVSDFFTAAQDPAASFEELVDDLKTGAWHTAGSALDVDIVLSTTSGVSRAVRLRRVGEDVELKRLDPSCVVTVNGQVTDEAIVSLQKDVVEIDGQRLSDEMLPVDTLDLGDVPDYFAPILIGRSPDCDFVLTEDSVSARHAGLSRQDGYLLLEDLDSANGTYVADRRVKRVRVGWRTEFEIGGRMHTALDIVRTVRAGRLAESTSVLPVLGSGSSAMLGPLGGRGSGELPGGLSQAIDLDAGGILVVGRDPKADIVLDTPNVSRRHARIQKLKGAIFIEDLGSVNGTWINGERIQVRTQVAPGDDVRIGPQRLELTEDLAVQTQAALGGVTGVRLDAAKLIREVGSRSNPLRVIDQVSFSILPGEMVAIMGPSGAGKTSVLTTLAGYTPPSGGHVYMDGMSLYRHYGVFRSAIGYVPQEDVMHRSLTVEEVLFYQAKLNFPSEVSNGEIRDRITTVLRQLDLLPARESIVGDEVRRGLSGGQRRRLNVAMELLSEPSVLLLDEPTSGLDARSAMQLIRQCRGLASSGRTVIMTIHQPRREAFDLFDKLLLLTKGGKLAFFGPAREAKRYFTERSAVPPETAKNPADYVLDVLDPLDETVVKKPQFWRKEYRESPLHERFVRNRLRRGERELERQAAGRSRPRKAAALRQTVTLTRRYARLKWRDRSALVVQLAQAPIIALLGVLLFHKGTFQPVLAQDDITPTLFVLVAAAVWFGCSNVAREIVGESAIFRRERYSRLRPGPYLASKFLVQGGLIAVQILVMLAILVPTVGLQGHLPLLAGTALLAGWSAMAMGFLISTVAKSQLQAIQFVPLVILPQVMLSGVLVAVVGKNASAIAAWLSKAALLRWAYSGLVQVEMDPSTGHGESTRTTTGQAYWNRVGFPDNELVLDLAVMGGMGLACAFACWVLLLRRDSR